MDQNANTRKGKGTDAGATKAKVLAILVIVLGLLIVGATGYVVFDRLQTKNDEKANQNDKKGDNTDKTAPYNYLGTWYINGEAHYDADGADTYERELTILEISNDSAQKPESIKFDLVYYRLTSIDGVVAEFDGDTAAFITESDVSYATVKGTLKLVNDSIQITITESNDPHITTGDLTFTSKK